MCDNNANNREADCFECRVLRLGRGPRSSINDKVSVLAGGAGRPGRCRQSQGEGGPSKTGRGPAEWFHSWHG